MEFALVLLLVTAVAAFVAAPLRSGAATSAQSASAERSELEAARDAKYREIRDAELDFRTGKLSEEEWHDQDRGLKRQAMELLRRLDDVGAREDEAAVLNAADEHSTAKALR
ncbi:MAG: hypothetical protein M3P40_03430 [Actinomycetota bacterium]|nr:hypothetical protein [Actinomycetota bacterium]